MVLSGFGFSFKSRKKDKTSESRGSDMNHSLLFWKCREACALSESGSPASASASRGSRIASCHAWWPGKEETGECKNKSLPQGKLQRDVCILKEASRRTFPPTKQRTVRVSAVEVFSRSHQDSENRTTKPLRLVPYSREPSRLVTTREYLWQTRKVHLYHSLWSFQTRRVLVFFVFVFLFFFCFFFSLIGSSVFMES